MLLILSSFVRIQKYRNLLHCVVSLAQSKWLVSNTRSPAALAAGECHKSSALNGALQEKNIVFFYYNQRKQVHGKKNNPLCSTIH